jgi:2'-5' RNA ligase
MRLFVGVELTGDARDEVMRVRELLVNALPKQGVRFVRSEKLHLTLAFLGNVAEDQLDPLKIALDAVAAKALSVELDGLGAFPDMRRPKVIYVGLSGQVEELGRIGSEVTSAAMPFAPERDEKTFAPHVTLARIKPGSKEVGRKVMKLGLQVAATTMPVSEFALFHSKADGNYEKLHTVKLG